MKLLSAILILAQVLVSVSFSMAQVIMPIENGVVLYSKDVLVNGSKDNLFLRSKDWIASSYKNYKAVIQLEEKDLGRLRLSAVTAAVDRDKGRARYSIDISCTDNACRFVIHSIELYSQELKGDLVPYDVYYNGYLSYYKEIGALKEQIKTETKKKVVKAKEKQIFDTEGKMLFMLSHISLHNREFNDLVNSYTTFMK